jgi:cell division protein FtsW (lipid II flippase)
VTAPTVTPATSRGPRRNAELAMLAFAVAIGMAAYAAVGLAVEEEVPADILGYTAGFAVLFLTAHLVIRRVAPYADPLLLPGVALLNCLGLALIQRLDLAEAERARQLGNTAPRPDTPSQLAWTAVGVLLLLLVLWFVRDHRVLQRYTYTAGFVAFGLLLLPLLPVVGVEVNGARIWLRIAGFSVQPGEFAKLALAVFSAGYLVAKRDVLALASRRFLGIDLPRGRDLGPIVGAWIASLGVLVFQRDLGTSLLYFGLFLVVLYVATERTSWLIIGLSLFLGGSYLAYHLFGHVRLRVRIWLDPFADAAGAGYQVVQSLFGFGTGGMFGTGLGQGRPEIVPFAKTDFIIATLGEELGLIGVMAVLVLYGLLVQRGLRAGLGVRDSFGKLLAVALAFSLALQVFTVVGGATRLIPLTGLTLPFLSYGGSSLVANYALIGLLLRISDAARRPGPGLNKPVGPTARTGELDAVTEVVRR